MAGLDGASAAAAQESVAKDSTAQHRKAPAAGYCRGDDRTRRRPKVIEVTK